MTATSHPEFNSNTEGLEVAEAFASGIRGKTVVVTGVNRGGIGFTTAEAFASQSPAHLVIVGRSLSKMQESIDALRAKYPDVDYRPLQCNLSSQQSVRAGAAELLSWPDVPTVDILVNSAGVMAVPERTLSEDGIELQFATNHVGHFLLTCLIMPKLIAAAKRSPRRGATRVVNVSSGSVMFAAMRWSDVNFDKKNTTLPAAEQPPYDLHRMWGTLDPEGMAYIPLEGYNQSKVANVLFGIAANRRLYDAHGILSLGVHPGVMRTELERSFSAEMSAAVDGMADKGFFSYRTVGAGASTSLVAALDPKLGLPGQQQQPAGKAENYGAFLEDCQISTKPRPLAVSSDEAEKLWKLSEELVKEKFAW